MNGSSEQRITRYIFIVSFLVSAIVLIVLAVKQPLRSNIVFAFLWGIILAGGAIVLGRIHDRHQLFLRIALLVSVFNCIIVPPEAYLRYTGFRYESGIQFGYPRPYQFSVFEPDEHLFWKFPPSQPGINRYGFPTREVTTSKPPGTFRILYIGNSCTFQGIPRFVEEDLQERHAGIECLNFAVPGYTTYQGKVTLKLYLDEVDPDLVVASFGWNDRWLAYGEVDEDKQVRVSYNFTARALRAVYSKWRLLQFFRRLLSPVLGRVEPLDVSRVPIGQFRANLAEIGDLCSVRGIPVIFATEPSAYPALGVPDYVVESGYAKSKESSSALYRAYNETMREVTGGRDGWHLIDLDAAISGRADVGELFKGDGIHFTGRGLELVAGIEARYIEEHILTRH
ncbi:MAG TPA: GDSL-type esterase/lipase family protein [Patescibacteria group bacterium]|nr:GDSL-type esterase/lipase family protein [Patescibacteria group bacterium]